MKSPMEAERRNGDGGGDVVLITGCSKGGLGHALALAFAQAGCRVVATARSLASMEGLLDDEDAKTKGQLRIETLRLDVTSQESREEAVATVLDHYGRIDILVNNAGVHCIAPVAEMPLSLLHSAFNTNVFAPIGLVQAVVPQMIARRKGKIVNIGSVAAFTSGPWAGGYSASKAAIHALSDSLRVELKPFGVDVIVVAPGAIKSNIEVNASQVFQGLPRWKFYQPWENSMKKRMGMSQQSGSTTAEEFAGRTVKEVLKGKPKPIFIVGALSFKLTLLYYLPLWVTDFIYMKIFGLKADQIPNKMD